MDQDQFLLGQPHFTGIQQTNLSNISASDFLKFKYIPGAGNPQTGYTSRAKFPANSEILSARSIACLLRQIKAKSWDCTALSTMALTNRIDFRQEIS
jgi:hypothetical protein